MSFVAHLARLASGVSNGILCTDKVTNVDVPFSLETYLPQATSDTQSLLDDKCTVTVVRADSDAILSSLSASPGESIIYECSLLRSTLHHLLES